MTPTVVVTQLPSGLYQARCELDHPKYTTQPQCWVHRCPLRVTAWAYDWAARVSRIAEVVSA